MRTTLNTVTFTGIDDTITAEQLLDASRAAWGAYPGNIEWGVLVSRSNEGGPRFPSLEAIDGFLKLNYFKSSISRVTFSMHVCGAWVRQICDGDWDPLLSYFGERRMRAFRRVQLNFHARTHYLAPAFFPALKLVRDHYKFNVIAQVDGANDNVAQRCANFGIPVHPLFDKSGGAGILPETWPESPGIYCGYAGGLGPENIKDQLAAINAAARDRPYWIDMETKVRDANDRFDFDACIRVLRTISEAYPLTA